MTEIAEPKLKELEKIIFNPFVNHKSEFSTDLVRIENEDDFTRIDFITYASMFEWVQISKDTFIRPIGTSQRLKLVKAVNIPITPLKHYFKGRNDILSYTLYFPPLPKGIESIDIIEFEGSGGNWFNFYGVSMTRVRSERIIAGN